MNSPKAFLSYVKENEPIVRFLDQVLTDYGINVVTNYKNIDGVKCIRLFRPQFRKVKIRFVVEIP